MLVVILVVALVILLKSCLDCPGLVPSLCCGESGSSELSSYHLEIVYKVIPPPHHTNTAACQSQQILRRTEGAVRAAELGVRQMLTPASN